MASVRIPNITFNIEVDEISKINLMGIQLQTFTLQGMSWFVNLSKHTYLPLDSSPYLAVFLYCSHENGSHWTCDAKINCKLLSHNAKIQTIEHDSGMQKFSPKKVGWGFNKFIHWNELFIADKEFVSDDKIVMKFAITAETPKYAFWNRIAPININNVMTTKRNCFVDSLLKILYFCKYSFQLNKEDTVCNALKKFENFFNSRSDYIKELFNDFDWVTADPRKQDVLNFTKSFLTTIKTEMGDDKAAVMLWSAFEGIQLSYSLMGNGKRRIIDDSKQFYCIRLEQESGR